MNGIAELLEAVRPGFVAALAIKAGVVVLLGWAAAAAMRSAGAAARHLLWAIVVVGLLLLPLLSLALPDVELPLLAARKIGTPVPAAGRAGGATSTTAVEASGERALIAPLAAAASVAASPSAGPDSGTAALRAAMAGYVAVVLLLLARTWLGLLRLRAIRRGAVDVSDDPDWQSLIQASVERVWSPRGKGRRAVAVLLSPDVSVPMTWGWQRPVVVLPEVARCWSAARRRQALVHELAHVGRFDWPVQMLVRVCCALYWPHPLAWLAARRTLLEAERACDDRVLLAGASSSDYAEQLLDLARRPCPRAALASGAVTMSRRSQVRVRIDSILDPAIRRSTMTRKRVLATAAAGILVVSTPAPFELGAAPVAVAAEPAHVPGPGGNAAGTNSPEAATQRNAVVVPADGMTPLMRSVARGDLSEIRGLLGDGADPNRGRNGMGTPLIIAAANGDLEAVELLLQAGADPNRTARLRGYDQPLLRTALATAAKWGHEGVVRRLLAAGADVRALPAGDASALMEAAGGGHDRVVGLLLEAGADADRVVPGDGTPLMSAARSGNAELVERLLARGADPDRFVPGDGTALIQAVRGGDRRTVRVLLDAGADPNLEAPGDGNPLQQAVDSGNDEIVRMLISAGARIDNATPGDGTALIEAARQGNAELVARLIRAGATVDQVSPGDGNPLIMAAAHGHLGVARQLVEAGAEIDRVVRGDENALIGAARHGHLEIVRYLLDQGADVNARVWADTEYRTPLTMATRGGHDDVVELLRARGATR